MRKKETIVKSYQEAVELIRSFDNGNEEMSEVAQQLANILERIPSKSIGEIYAKITEDNLLKMGVRHNNDRFRLVQILIGNVVVGVTTCMMKDTLNFQLENGKSPFNSMSELATPYFEVVFGSGFQKVVTKNNGEIVRCVMRFDDERFSNRLYGAEEDKFTRFTETGATDEQCFRYLSFFEVYDYHIRNEIVDKPN